MSAERLNAMIEKIRKADRLGNADADREDKPMNIDIIKNKIVFFIKYIIY